MAIKDTAYASLFDKEDLPYLYRLAEKVRNTHNPNLVNDFNNACQRKWNDHNPILGDNANVEFLQVSKADDLVVTVGINLCIDEILGTSVVRWQMCSAGTGTTAPTIADTIIASALTTVDMNTSGWREYAGASLRFGAIFGESTLSGTINECVILPPSVTTPILNRNVFSNFPITHTQNVTGFVISSVVEFVPVM